MPSSEAASTPATAAGRSLVTFANNGPAGWLVDRVVVTHADTGAGALTARVFLGTELGQLVAGTATGRQDTADDPAGVPVPPGAALTVAWDGAAPGTIGRASIAYRLDP